MRNLKLAPTGFRRTEEDGQGGFTALELVIVVTILAFIFTLSFAFIRRTATQNHVNECAGQLRAIARALQLYRLDYGDVPPWEPAQVNDAGRGLWALYDLNYLTNVRVLNCPDNPTSRYDETQDVNLPAAYSDPTNPNYNGYQMQDPITGEWKYLPGRWQTYGDAVGTPGNPYYLRQLGRWVKMSNNSLVEVKFPADNTVVTWCHFHRDSYTREGVGQDLVVYSDGHVEFFDQPRAPTEGRAMLVP
ncbi:MAG TPA: type II secretion system protein [Armatimonadetes bacterium]|nr:type II secretion system protein [Armatimonadota bacterium]